MYSWEEEEEFMDSYVGNRSSKSLDGNVSSKSFDGTDLDEDDLDRLDPEARNELETLLFAQVHFANDATADGRTATKEGEDGSKGSFIKDAIADAADDDKNANVAFFVDSSGTVNDPIVISSQDSTEEVELPPSKEATEPQKKKKKKKRKEETDVEILEIPSKKKKQKEKDNSKMTVAKKGNTPIEHVVDPIGSPSTIAEILKDNNSLEAILATIADDESWKIDFCDSFAFRRTARYFAPAVSSLNSVTCYNCAKKGHLSKYCPGPKRFDVCYACGRREHFSGKCDNVVCTRCLGRGHQQFYCRVPIGNGGPCFRCGGFGHFHFVCPELWRQHHMSVGANSDNDKDDDDEDVGEVEEDSLKPSCFNCGRWGHLGHQCEAELFRKNMYPNSPFVFKYDAVVERKPTPSAPKSCPPKIGGAPLSKGRKVQLDSRDDDGVKVTLNFDESADDLTKKDAKKSNKDEKAGEGVETGIENRKDRRKEMRRRANKELRLEMKTGRTAEKNIKDEEFEKVKATMKQSWIKNGFWKWIHTNLTLTPEKLKAKETETKGKISTLDDSIQSGSFLHDNAIGDESCRNDKGGKHRQLQELKLEEERERVQERERLRERARFELKQLERECDERLGSNKKKNASKKVLTAVNTALNPHRESKINAVENIRKATRDLIEENNNQVSTAERANESMSQEPSSQTGGKVRTKKRRKRPRKSSKDQREETESPPRDTLGDSEPSGFSADLLTSMNSFSNEETPQRLVKEKRTFNNYQGSPNLQRSTIGKTLKRKSSEGLTGSREDVDGFGYRRVGSPSSNRSVDSVAKKTKKKKKTSDANMNEAPAPSTPASVNSTGKKMKWKGKKSMPAPTHQSTPIHNHAAPLKVTLSRDGLDREVELNPSHGGRPRKKLARNFVINKSREDSGFREDEEDFPRNKNRAFR